MTLFPGDTLEGDGGRRFKVGRMVAYRGKPDCTSPWCTRRGWTPEEPGECFGWHCSLCDAPTSMMGHSDCPRAGEVDA